jgi:hypothetical protein
MNPASIRETSIAVKPVGSIRYGFPAAVTASQTRGPSSLSTQISYPRSPVYPVLEICTSTPSSFARARLKNLSLPISSPATCFRISRELGPCSARAPSRAVLSSIVTRSEPACRWSQLIAGRFDVSLKWSSSRRESVPSSMILPSSSHQHR